MSRQRSVAVAKHRDRPKVAPPDRHSQALEISSFLTLTYRRMYQQEAAMIAPEAIIQTLNAAGVGFVLMGTHGIGGWRNEPRATQAVEILARKRDHQRAVQASCAHYPKLTFEDFPEVTRFTEPATGKAIIDLMKPAQPVFKMVFRNTVVVGDTHRVPNLEMALVSKFAAMTSPHRAQDKTLIDGGDFVNMVRSNQQAIQRAKLRRLADRVYPDGGAEILKMVDDVQAERRIRF